MFETSKAVLSLDEVMQLVFRVGARIGLPKEQLQTFGSAAEGESIEVGRSYHLKFVERGKEFERRTTDDVDELLYWVFRDVTSGPAAKYELNSRNPNEDFRRRLFQHQLGLL